MKIYKVCGNYLKGVQEFEIKKINPDNKRLCDGGVSRHKCSTHN